MTQSITSYLTQIAQNLATGDATEHTHRPALASLLESLIPAVQAINEPRRIACGAPDLAVLRDGLLVGHVEAKDVGTVLDVAERAACASKSEQLRRYRDALDNLILTDFLVHTPESIATPRELVERMARLAHLIRAFIVIAFETDRASETLKG
jgi:hypothetical protein